jgi:serine/threonine protein kinase
MGAASNWHELTPSPFPWEREALDYVRARFPTHDAYRAWSLFEFIADDGSVNEVDLLAFTPQGFFLVEVKSAPGILNGDAHTWTWVREGRRRTADNPYLLANVKAKRLASLLGRQKAFAKLRVPFIDALVFCSAEGLDCRLETSGQTHVCLRDGDDQPGIMAALKRREAPALGPLRGAFDRPMLRAVARALDEAGVRATNRSRQVGDYRIGTLLDTGLGYQDFEGQHVSLSDARRRVRIYPVRAESDADQRRTFQRAAEREFRLLQFLDHPNILRALDFTAHERGPVILFQHEPDAVRLDHFMAQRQGAIADELRLHLLRQLAEAVRFAHGKNIIHRALSPRAILVAQPDSGSPQVKVMNWQLGFRQRLQDGPELTRVVTATLHGDVLADDLSQLFMAPEALAEAEAGGEHLDIFSLGALAYWLFTGQMPANSPVELAEKLRAQRGLRVSAICNTAAANLERLVQESTDPDVTLRLDSTAEFIELLDKVEDELTTPANQFSGDPTQAHAKDVLPGGFEVLRKLGTGSSATALLVEKDSREYVIKVAIDADHNDRVRAEGEVLRKLSDHRIVRCHDTLTLNDRAAILLDRAGESTLGLRLRQEGRLSLELLQRFGEDLLEAVCCLERDGIAHRDIKPDNIGVAKVGADDTLHLVLFDFSLSRCSPENIHAGTPGYLDPFLALRQPRRWDLQAERYAVAVTLYEMATAVRPVWHDGHTDPSMVDCEVTIDAERFVPELRDQLSAFFRRGLRRNPRERFDNAQAMLEAWRGVFSTVTATTHSRTAEGVEADPAALEARATPETLIAALGLDPAMTDALDRVNVVRVQELLTVSTRRLRRMRGVGNQTRKRIAALAGRLRERLGGPPASVTREQTLTETPEGGTSLGAADGPPSVDLLLQAILGAQGGRQPAAAEATALPALLGLDERLADPWPAQDAVAVLANVTRGRVSQILAKARERWGRQPAITGLRQEMTALLSAHGGVMTTTELAGALLLSRGSAANDDGQRLRLAHAVVRAAVEMESSMEQARFLPTRHEEQILVATDCTLADYAVALGHRADTIASQDPLLPSPRVLELLREVTPPAESDPLADSRLLRLSASASRTAAISSKQELYPRGMDAARALKLSQGALAGPREMTVAAIQQRIRSRYPEAAPLPPRDALTPLLAAAGLELEWDPACGAYVSRARSVLSVTTPSSLVTRVTTGPAGAAAVTIPGVRPGFLLPEVAEARQFEERLSHAERRGAFLALVVKPNLYQVARTELAKRFRVRPIDLEKVFLDALRQAAAEVGADWTVVVNADVAAHDGSDWRNLNHLIGMQVMPKVEAALLEGDGTVLAYHINWLARYGQVSLLPRLAAAVQDGRLHGAWWLIPASPQQEMPMLDGQAVPVITANQWATVPEGWCRNLHRADPARVAGGGGAP